MRHIATALSLILLLLSAAFAEEESAPPPSVLSIIPGQGSPGSTVVISGAGLNADSTLHLGIEEIPLKLISSRQISFEIPPLPAGNYALYLRQKSGAASKAYSFAVTPLKPSVSAVSPDAVSFCATGSDRSRVLFDGAIIKGSRISAEEMTFQAPPVPGGLHQVQVKNSEDSLSPAIALLVASQPEILSVNQGNDYVNYYELNIEGINFQYGSSLIVDGKKIPGGQPSPGERDRLVFKSCSRLTYQRYPYDPSMKSFEMIVVNPNGEESSHFTVSAP